MNGIVILNYNDYQTVLELYERICNYSSLDHIVIVDNHSTDNSYQELKLKCNCDVIKTPRNGGYAYGNNYGVRYLIDNYSCDYIIISNPDVMFNDDLIKTIVLEMKNNSNIAIMSGVMLDRDRKETRLAYGKIPSYLDALLECFCVSRYYQRHVKKNPIDYSSKYMEVEVVWGSLFVISSDTFLKLGGFDEGTFLYHEENILAEKVKRAKMKEVILTSKSYIHKHSVSISKNSNRVARHIAVMNSQYYLQTKYHNISNTKKVLLTCFIKFSILELRMLEFFIDLICFRKDYVK